MNATARALAASGVIINRGICRKALLGATLSKQNILFLLLLISVWFSAFGVVYLKDINRQLVNELQTLNNTQDKLQIEWGKLLLEQSTLATQSRVQRMADEKLGMVMPTATTVEMLSL